MTFPFFISRNRFQGRNRIPTKLQNRAVRLEKFTALILRTAYLLSAVLCLFCAGCREKQGTTLTIVGSADDIRKPYMLKIIGMYEKSSGNTVRLKPLPNGNFETLAQTMFSSGEKPDLFMHFSGYQLDTYNLEENFFDFSGEEWVSDVEDLVLPQCTRDGKVYGFPFWEASLSGCFYNKALLRKLGIGKLPETQEEFNALCDLLTEKGVQPIYMGAGDTWPLLYQFALDPVFAGKRGAELVKKLNANELSYVDIPEFKQMLIWFKTAAERGWFGKTWQTDLFSPKQTSRMLNSGKAAMIFCWDSWFYTDFQTDGAEYTVNDFGVMPVFMGTAPKGTFEGPNISLLLVNKNSPNLQQALEFIRFASVPENYNRAFEGIGTMPVFRTQTSNILSMQYIESRERINRLFNASAQLQINGFSQREGGQAIKKYMAGAISLERCIALMDADRIATAILVRSRLPGGGGK